jgi:hypothetical protein
MAHQGFGSDRRVARAMQRVLSMIRSFASLAAVLLLACGGATPTPTGQPGGGVPDTAHPITHPLEGREDCTSCHSVSAATKPLPSSHQGRDNATCKGCHHPKAG